MAASKIVMQSADGASVGLTIPDGLTSGERTIALGANLSGVTAYHLLNGEVSVSNGIITSGFSTTLYTSGSATTGIDMDTQWGNDASERFGGLVWLKDRVEATNHFLYDTIRGATKEINSNTTEAEATLAGGLTGFTSTGFTVGADTGHNSTTNNMVSWNFQTTHRRTGTTNHGKAFTEHYNPFTGFTIIKYEGSGLAGHEIPHSLGRKLGFVTVKNLNAATVWQSTYDGINRVFLNLTNAQSMDNYVISLNENNIAFNSSAGTLVDLNASTNQHILYGWANSYFDESNKLIGNYEIGVYQGTGASGNKVKTKGKPAWIMQKRIDDIGNWNIMDIQRANSDGVLRANTSDAEASANVLDIVSDGFVLQDTSIYVNASGGQYLYMVVYDNDNGSGKSKYQKATDSSQLQINALIPFANGVDGNGAKNTILSKNETITGLTLTQGKNYVYGKNDGSYGVKPYRPRYLSSDLVRTYAGESPDYYDVKSNKWFNTDAGSELVTNGTGLSLTGWVAKDVNSGYPDSTLLLSNQTIVITNSSTAGSNGGAYQLLTGLTVGKKYKVKLSQDGTVQIQVGTTSYLASVRYATSSVGATEFEFIAQATSVYLTFYNSVNTANDSCWIDNVSCFQTDITPTSEITDSRNYLDAIIYADHNGQIEYVEQLPKTQYVDEMKANEFKGKNACTAYLESDGITTPPMVRDNYNFSSIIRTATGKYEAYFTTPMDKTTYTPIIIADGGVQGARIIAGIVKGLDKISFEVGYYSSGGSYSLVNGLNISIHIDGGKN